jgi:type II secretory pathway pseudopilin PulG
MTHFNGNDSRQFVSRRLFSRKARAGMMLVELVSAMGIAATVLGVLAFTFSRVLTANEKSHEHVRMLASLGRLGEQLRQDVHTASAAQVTGSDNETSRLTLTTDAGQIEFEITPTGLTRRVKGSTGPERRESYQLAGLKPLSWQLDEGGRQVALRLGRLGRDSQGEPIVGSQFSISATRGTAEPAVQATEPTGGSNATPSS